MDEASFVQAGTISGRVRDPRKHLDHRKYDKDKPKPYLDWSEFLAYMLEDQQSSATSGSDSERPAIVADIIHHLTGIQF